MTHQSPTTDILATHAPSRRPTTERLQCLRLPMLITFIVAGLIASITLLIILILAWA